MPGLPGARPRALLLGRDHEGQVAPPAATSTSGRRRTRVLSTTSTSISPAVSSRIFRRASTTSAPHDFALRRLRVGDYRGAFIEAAGLEPSLAQAPVVVASASTYWRNAWKYRERAYRHAFWDGGTLHANLLAVAAAQGLAAKVVAGFADRDVEHLLGLDPAREGALALVPLGRTAEPPAPAPDAPLLNLETEPLSSSEIDYPAIRELHSASSLEHGEEAARWRGAVLPRPGADPLGELFPLRPLAEADWPAEPLESVILRRGSTRRFDVSRSLSFEELSTALAVASASIPADFTEDPESSLLDLYVIAHAVKGLPPGAYYLRRAERALELLKEGEFRLDRGPARPLPRASRRCRGKRLLPRGSRADPGPVRQSRLSGRSARGRNRRRPPLPRRLRPSFRRHRTHLPRRRGDGVLLPSRRREKRDVPDRARPPHSPQPRPPERLNRLAMLLDGAPAGGLLCRCVNARTRGSRSCRRGGRQDLLDADHNAGARQGEARHADRRGRTRRLSAGSTRACAGLRRALARLGTRGHRRGCRRAGRTPTWPNRATSSPSATCTQTSPGWKSSAEGARPR